MEINSLDYLWKEITRIQELPSLAVQDKNHILLFLLPLKQPGKLGSVSSPDLGVWLGTARKGKGRDLKAERVPKIRGSSHSGTEALRKGLPRSPSPFLSSPLPS